MLLKTTLLQAVFLFFLSDLKAQCSAVVSTFPYSESFETGTGNWVSGGINNDWAWGSPSKATINSAGAGTNCWITGGLSASFYNYGERSWVESPCFDFTLLDRPYVSFLIFWETERNYDGGNFQYSDDNGQTWKNIGTVSTNNSCTDQNWFNLSSIINLNNLVNVTSGWSGNIQPSSGSCSGGGGSGTWKRATHCMQNLANKPLVKFRFTFGSGTTCNDFDGLAFDDFTIGSAPSLPVDFSYICQGNLLVNFTDASAFCHNFWEWNFGDSLSPINTAATGAVSHQFSSGGTFNVTFRASGNCISDSTIVRQITLPEATTSFTPVSCENGNDGSASVLVLNPYPGLNFNWSHNSSLNSPVANSIPVGSYLVILSDSQNCSRSFAIDVPYGPDAFPRVDLGNDTVLCPGNALFLNAGNFTRYNWQDNSTDSIYTVIRAGDYAVTVTNSSGCSTGDSIQIKEDCLNDIIIPNAFSPNGDGMNDYFMVSGSKPQSFLLRVFNRWGEMIYTSEKTSEGWDGSVKGKPVQEGIYTYLVNYSIFDKELTRKGSICVIR